MKIYRQYIDNIFDRFEYIDNLFRKKGQFIEIDLDNKYTIKYLNWIVKCMHFSERKHHLLSFRNTMLLYIVSLLSSKCNPPNEELVCPIKSI